MWVADKTVAIIGDRARSVTGGRRKLAGNVLDGYARLHYIPRAASEVGAMQFNVASLLKEPTGATRSYSIDDGVTINGVARHVRGQVRFDRTPRGVLVRANAHGVMDDVCSRCVKPIAFAVDIDLAEEYIPRIDLANGAAVQIEEGEEDAYRIDARHMIDLAEPVMQYWALALPMAPVCDEGCEGLCPVCGEDMAALGHACTGDQIDSRWSALARLEL